MMNARPASTPPAPKDGAGPTTADIEITAGHVYLPLDDNGDALADWAVTNVSTTKVFKGTRLAAPADLAVFLADRGQAEIL